MDRSCEGFLVMTVVCGLVSLAFVGAIAYAVFRFVSEAL